jgi:uncharacterized protein YbaA (DUF1428 family)
MSSRKMEGIDGTYVHIFVYRIPKENHHALLNVQEKLAKIYKRHGTLESRFYQLGKTNVFEEFSGFDKALGTSEGDEVWVEVDSYRDASDFERVTNAIGGDTDAGPLWGELAQVTSKHAIIMGEFSQISKS